MPPTQPLPAIDDCIELYAEVHDRFGSEPFDVTTLFTALPDDFPASDEASLTRHLDLLCAYGLLGRTLDGTYERRCAPGEPLSEWRGRATARIDRLHRLVEESIDGAAEPPTGGAEGAVVSYNDETFVRITIDGVSDGAARTRIHSALRDRPESDGIVLCSSGERAGAVQRLADDLCDPEVSREGVALEKETTDLIGAEKDELEFRLYLRRAD